MYWTVTHVADSYVNGDEEAGITYMNWTVTHGTSYYDHVEWTVAHGISLEGP